MPSLPVTSAYGARSDRSAHALRRFVAGTVLAACATSAVVVVGQGGWIAPADMPAFWLLAACCAAGELMPIRLERIRHCDVITMSSAVAFAILLAFGLLPAIVVYAGASALADLRNRTGAEKAAFNAAQYVLALAAAAAVMGILGHAPGVGFVASDLPVFLAGASAFLVANHVLAGTAVALFTGRRVLAYLGADLGFHAWTSGLQLVLAPVAVLAAAVNSALVPLVLLPLLGICWAGRRAAEGAHPTAPTMVARADGPRDATPRTRRPRP